MDGHRVRPATVSSRASWRTTRARCARAKWRLKPGVRNTSFSDDFPFCSLQKIRDFGVLRASFHIRIALEVLSPRADGDKISARGRTGRGGDGRDDPTAKIVRFLLPPHARRGVRRERAKRDRKKMGHQMTESAMSSESSALSAATSVQPFPESFCGVITRPRERDADDVEHKSSICRQFVVKLSSSHTRHLRQARHKRARGIPRACETSRSLEGPRALPSCSPLLCSRAGALSPCPFRGRLVPESHRSCQKKWHPQRPSSSSRSWWRPRWSPLTGCNAPRR